MLNRLEDIWHPHLLPLVGVMFRADRAQMSIVTPFVDNRSLPEYLIRHPSANRSRFVSRQIL